MAKTKAELLNEANELGLKVSEKSTVAEINELIAGAGKSSEKESEKADAQTAKAGKRSAKALAEAEEKAAKEERKVKSANEVPTKPASKPVKPTRSRLERRSKGYKKSAELIEKGKEYSLAEALELSAKTSHVKFDATVELHVRLGVDPKQADQNIRDNVVLPAGSGKKVKIAVFAEDDDAKKATAAGAEIAGNEDFLAKLEKNELDFDVLIATPNLMAKLAKYARILGPKGLMPNPKSGTVTSDVEKAVKQAKAGKIEYRVDSTGIVHVGIGKVSFGPGKLNDNAKAVLESIKQNKPTSLKANYVRSITITTSMGPSIKVQTSEL